MAKDQRVFTGTGRRKTSVARVRLIPGSGKITVNGRSKLIFVESNNPWSSRGSGTAGDPYVISSSYGDTIS